MGGDQSRASRFQQEVEDGAGQRCAFLRIGACTEFIEDDEGTVINLLEDADDVRDVTTERAERLLDRLFIANVGIDRVEAWQLRTALCWDVQSALRHEHE
jgi:hypothetical protein